MRLSINNNFISFAVICLGIGLLVIEKAYITSTSNRPQVMVYPSPEMVNFTFGYNDMISSSMWIRVLQDIEYCENGKYFAGADETEEQKALKMADATRLNYLLTKKLKPSNCHLGWVYQMLDIITTLDTDFLTAFQVGGTMLSVVVDDREGAKRLLEKGSYYFPEDWRLNYYTAYHYLFEIQDARKAAAYLRRSGEFGAPAWVYSLAAGLYTEVGQAQFAKTVLEAAVKRHKGAASIGRIRGRLQEVNQVLAEKAALDEKKVLDLSGKTNKKSK